MNDETKIADAIRKALDGAKVLVVASQGGFLVQVTWQNFDADDEVKNQRLVLDALKSAKDGFSDFVYLHRLFTYRDESAAFVVPGTLRQIATTHVGTMSSTTFSASDVSIFVREIDSEFLMMGEYGRTEVRARERDPLDGTLLATPFKELDVHGAEYPVFKLSREGNDVVVEVGEHHWQ